MADRAPSEPQTPQVEILRRLAKEATNGWACYAKTKREHDEIARLHRKIDLTITVNERAWVRRYNLVLASLRALADAHREGEWHKAEGHPPPPVGDSRKLVVLLDKDGMEWVGIRAYHHGAGYWMVGNQREESATVLYWQDLPDPPRQRAAQEAPK